MNRHAICYFASSGYLFETVVSASQARALTGDWVDVFVVFADDGNSAHEFEAFCRICSKIGVTLIMAPLRDIGGSAKMGRLYIDRFLPVQYTEFLYLDGDTQIIKSLNPLLSFTPPAGQVAAARDPMTFIRSVHRRLGRQIDGWITDGGGDPREAADYINSGMLRVSRDQLIRLRKNIDDKPPQTAARFVDQDLINHAVQGRLAHVSIGWNFPGFLLNTAIHSDVDVRVIHFMSNPRPWTAPYSPWGEIYFGVYETFVRDNPEIAEFWARDSPTRRIRYHLQQAFKGMTERRVWNSAKARSLVSAQEAMTFSLEPSG